MVNSILFFRLYQNYNKFINMILFEQAQEIIRLQIVGKVIRILHRGTLASNILKIGIALVIIIIIQVKPVHGMIPRIAQLENQTLVKNFATCGQYYHRLPITKGILHTRYHHHGRCQVGHLLKTSPCPLGLIPTTIAVMLANHQSGQNHLLNYLPSLAHRSARPCHRVEQARHTSQSKTHKWRLGVNLKY